MFLWFQLSILFCYLKGKLDDGRLVAVKKLAVEKSQQGESQFLSEVRMITSIQHKNLVRLLGCCSDGTQRLLVYEYMKNRSLDLIVYGNTLTYNFALVLKSRKIARHKLFFRVICVCREKWHFFELGYSISNNSRGCSRTAVSAWRFAHQNHTQGH